MATTYNRDSNTFSHIGVPFNYNRGNPMPLDNTTIWTSLSAAQEYAASSPVAYVGQLVTVVDSAASAVTVYKIDYDSSLTKIASNGIMLSGGDGIEVTEAGYINAKVSTGLSVVNGNIEVMILNIYGGTATDVNTPIDSSL